MPTGKEVKKLVESADKSQASIARKLGVTRSGLAYHLNKNDNIDDELYRKILKIIKSSVEEPVVPYSDFKGEDLILKLKEEIEEIKFAFQLAKEKILSLEKENYELKLKLSNLRREESNEN